MDTLLYPPESPCLAETMINLEARKLVNTANTASNSSPGSFYPDSGFG
jgi:hypothetical protein